MHDNFTRPEPARQMVEGEWSPWPTTEGEWSVQQSDASPAPSEGVMVVSPNTGALPVDSARYTRLIGNIDAVVMDAYERGRRDGAAQARREIAEGSKSDGWRHYEQQTPVDWPPSEQHARIGKARASEIQWARVRHGMTFEEIWRHPRWGFNAEPRWVIPILEALCGMTNNDAHDPPVLDYALVWQLAGKSRNTYIAALKGKGIEVPPRER